MFFCGGEELLLVQALTFYVHKNLCKTLKEKTKMIKYNVSPFLETVRGSHHVYNHWVAALSVDVSEITHNSSYWVRHFVVLSECLVGILYPI